MVATAATLAMAAMYAVPGSAAATDGGLYVSEANQERSSYGIRPFLSYSSIAESAAEERARSLAGSNSLYHDLGPLTRRLQAAGICYARVGEIIANSANPKRDVAGTMNQWMASDAHRAIVLRSEYDWAAGSWEDAAKPINGAYFRYHVMYFIDPCNTPPPQISVSFSTLQNGQLLRGYVKWEAGVSNEPANRVEFYVDGALRWTERYAAYVYNGDGQTWATKYERDGSHTLTLRAVARDGSVATRSISVTIDN